MLTDGGSAGLRCQLPVEVWKGPFDHTRQTRAEMTLCGESGEVASLGHTYVTVLTPKPNDEWAGLRSTSPETRSMLHKHSVPLTA